MENKETIEPKSMDKVIIYKTDGTILHSIEGSELKLYMADNINIPVSSVRDICIGTVAVIPLDVIAILIKGKNE